MTLLIDMALPLDSNKRLGDVGDWDSPYSWPVRREFSRILHRPRPHVGIVYTERFLNSRPLTYFDDETKLIRAKAGALLRQVHTPLPKPSRILRPYETLDSYTSHQLIPYGVPQHIYHKSYFSEPAHLTIGRGHLACIQFAGGKGYPRRKHLYSDENRNIRDEIKFRSYYNRPKNQDSNSLATGFAWRLLHLPPKDNKPFKIYKHSRTMPITDSSQADKDNLESEVQEKPSYRKYKKTPTEPIEEFHPSQTKEIITEKDISKDKKKIDRKQSYEETPWNEYKTSDSSLDKQLSEQSKEPVDIAPEKDKDDKTNKKIEKTRSKRNLNKPKSLASLDDDAIEKIDNTELSLNPKDNLMPEMTENTPQSEDIAIIERIGDTSEVIPTKEASDENVSEIIRQESVQEEKPSEIIRHESVPEEKPSELIRQESVPEANPSEIIRQESVPEEKPSEIIRQESVPEENPSEIIGQENILEEKASEIVQQDDVPEESEIPNEEINKEKLEEESNVNQEPDHHESTNPTPEITDEDVESKPKHDEYDEHKSSFNPSDEEVTKELTEFHDNPVEESPVKQSTDIEISDPNEDHSDSKITDSNQSEEIVTDNQEAVQEDFAKDGYEHQDKIENTIHQEESNGIVEFSAPEDLNRSDDTGLTISQLQYESGITGTQARDEMSEFSISERNETSEIVYSRHETVIHGGSHSTAQYTETFADSDKPDSLKDIVNETDITSDEENLE